MIVRALDGNGDWQFGKGKNDYKRNLNATAQNISTRLKSFLNDCFFAANEGIDWFNLLGSKNQQAISLAVSSVILNTVDVTSIVSLQINLSVNRTITIQYNVSTVYGRTSDVVTSILE